MVMSLFLALSRRDASIVALARAWAGPYVVYGGVCSCVFYPTACSLKGYGSGLPLPSRTAAHFSALNRILSLSLCETNRGCPISFPHIRQRKGATQGNQNRTQSKQTETDQI